MISCPWSSYVFLLVCNSPILAPYMNYTESSSFKTKTGAVFSGRYVAESISVFPWGPSRNQENLSKNSEFVQVDLLDIYIINEIELIQPKYGNTKLKSPENLTLLSSLLPNQWFEYKDKTGKVVLLYIFL